MKGRHRHLLLFLLLSCLSVTVFLIPHLLLWWYVHSGCWHGTSTFSSREGNFDAILDEECCSGCTETVTLRRKWGFNTKIFVYSETDAYEPPGTPWTHNPVIVWLSPNELEIAVDRIGHIYTQLTEARGVRIIYRIGSVDEP